MNRWRGRGNGEAGRCHQGRGGKATSQVKKPSHEAQRGIAEELDKAVEIVTVKVQESAPALIRTAEAAREQVTRLT